MFRYVWNGLCRTVRSRPQAVAQTSVTDEENEVYSYSTVIDILNHHDQECLSPSGSYREFRNDLLLSTALIAPTVNHTTRRYLTTSSASSSSCSREEFHLTHYNDLPSPDLNYLLSRADIESLIRPKHENKVGRKPSVIFGYSSDNIGFVLKYVRSYNEETIASKHKTDTPIKQENGIRTINAKIKGNHVKFLPNVNENPEVKRSVKGEEANDGLSSQLHKFSSSTKDCVRRTHNKYGNQLMKEKKYKQAFIHFLLGALQGCSKSQFNVALCYQLGKGTKKDLKQAEYYYGLSANQDHPHAQYNLSLLLLEGDMNAFTKARVYNLLKRSAYQGFDKSQCLLGCLLINEDTSCSEAVKLFYQSSENGNILSKHHLAQCFHYGLGYLDIDLNKSFHLYGECSQHGMVNSQFEMACMLYDGEVTKNTKLAVEMFQEAAKKGSLKAKNKLTEIQNDTE